MGDEDEQQHTTMIKQLTDLDDHVLDEQAGLFMHPRRKSLKSEATPRPLSQPFFQPLQVFPDVLNVSAMVERQEQRDQKEQQQQQQDAAKDNTGDSYAAPLSNNKSSGAVSSMNTGYVQDIATIASATQDPHSLTSQASRVTAMTPAETAGNTPVMTAGAIGKSRSGLRSVSLTRLVGEASEGIINTLSSGDSLNRDAVASLEPRGGKPSPLPPPGDPGAHHHPQILRTGTPIETPNEEGERQLSVETSKASKAATKRSSARRTNDRPVHAKGTRLFVRRNNVPSRGSEDDDSDENEQFIYRNSRSSLHVSSIPEESYEDRELMSKRRSNRHRLSTYMSSDRRPSSGVGNGGGGGGSGGRAGSAGPPVLSSGSYFPAYGSSTAQGGGPGSASSAIAGASSSVGGSSRKIGRMLRSSNNPSGNTSNYASNSNAAAAMGHRFSILTQSNNEYGETSEESDLDAEPAGMRSTYNPYSRRSSRRFHSNVYYGSSEDLPETTPLFRRHIGQRRKQANTLMWLLRAVLLSLMALTSMFILVALFNFTSAPLMDVQAIKVSNILATEKELLFILHIQSTNPNIREVLIERSEIGVFAAAAVSNTTLNGSNGARLIAANETEPAILLGNVYELSDPMRFAPGSLRQPTTDVKTTQISIHHPGASIGSGDGDDENSDAAKWRRLLKGPYDLTIRGTLQYTLWQRNYASRICIAKLANLPADNSTALPFVTAAGLGCDEGDDDTITLPHPPKPPFGQLLQRIFMNRWH